MIAIAHAVNYGANIMDYAVGKELSKIVKLNHLPDDVSHYALFPLMLAHQKRTWQMRDHRKEIKNNVIKMEISPQKSESEGWTLDDWQKFVDEFLHAFDHADTLVKSAAKPKFKRTNICNSQYVAALHFDAKSGIPHIHLVANRVDMEGKTNNASFIAERARCAAEVVNRQRGWQRVEQTEKERKQMATDACLETLREIPNEFLWNAYITGLIKRGYDVKIRLDRNGIIVGYRIKTGNTAYKASELGNRHNLTAKHLQDTWQKLHGINSNMRNIEECKRFDIDFDSWPFVTNRAHSIFPKLSDFDLNINGKRYQFSIPTDSYRAIHDEVMAADISDNMPIPTALHTALLLFVGCVDAATALSESCGGGGSSSSVGWGRRDDEDEREWAYRCAQQAAQLSRPKSRTRRR